MINLDYHVVNDKDADFLMLSPFGRGLPWALSLVSPSLPPLSCTNPRPLFLSTTISWILLYTLASTKNLGLR